MESTPPVNLGVILLVTFAVAFILRNLGIKFFVLKAKLSVQPFRQFLFDFFLLIGAGLMEMAYYSIIRGNSFLSTAFLFVDFIVAGFFISLDMALYRERINILLAKQNNITELPEKFFPLTWKFSFVAVFTLIFACAVIFLIISRDISWISEVTFSEQTITCARTSALFEILFILAVLTALIINIIISYSLNLRLLFNNQTQVLEHVEKKDFSRLVPIATNDEFGLIAAHTNKMISGLKERTQLLAEMKLGEELQQSLLPDAPPSLKGLDIFGKSVYCNKTGGDYFDYITMDNSRAGFVIADASGHGIGSAIHMATARGIFRARAALSQSPEKIITGLNSMLTRDTDKTSRFMTLFFLVIDLQEKSLLWVRAGHDPALIFSASGNSFLKLMGKGPAMGLDPGHEYELNSKKGLKKGDIILLATDGVWETCNDSGNMLGRQSVKEIIRKNKEKSAREICEKIIDKGYEHRKGAPPEDDVTLILIKITD